ncbi:MAG: hypothetical protein J0H01_12800 [Rhizobiales bacterium]|nr:hypothetical protein [Hyphomicrobiales bacterium]
MGDFRHCIKVEGTRDAAPLLPITQNRAPPEHHVTVRRAATGRHRRKRAARSGATGPERGFPADSARGRVNSQKVPASDHRPKDGWGGLKHEIALTFA